MTPPDLGYCSARWQATVSFISFLVQFPCRRYSQFISGTHRDTSRAETEHALSAPKPLRRCRPNFTFSVCNLEYLAISRCAAPASSLELLAPNSYRRRALCALIAIGGNPYVAFPTQRKTWTRETWKRNELGTKDLGTNGQKPALGSGCSEYWVRRDDRAAAGPIRIRKAN